jgi:Flp pilus assembly protein TadD
MVEADLGTAANYDRLAQLLNTKHFRTEAIAASRQAVALEPDEYRYREALARLLLQNKEYYEALTQYTEAAKLAPNEFFAEQMVDRLKI